MQSRLARNSVSSGREASINLLVIPESAKRLSGIHNPGLCLWIPGSRASLAPRNDELRRMELPAPPLLLITDRSQARGNILDIAAAAFSAGCRWASLREKNLPKTEQAALLRELLTRAKPFGARVIVHSDSLVSRETSSHGVHLPAGGDAASARRILGKEALIGLSVHSAEEARNVDAALIDYVIAGPVFATASKPDYGPTLGPDGLALIVQASTVPVIAIGGITPENLPDCIAAGAAGIAVMGSVMRADDPQSLMQQFLAALSAPQPRPR
jgi:thiamine-phosphate pyrophosphorylase